MENRYGLTGPKAFSWFVKIRNLFVLENTTG